MPDTSISLRLKNGLLALKINLSEAAIGQLIEYIEEFQRWNKTHNLSAIHSLEESVDLHLLDSLAVLPVLDAYFDGLDLKVPPRIADLGSGGGLPGIVLAICRPQWGIYLMEAVGKKTVFLEHIKGRLKLSQVIVLSGRIETTSLALRESITICISRAFSDFGKFIELSKPMLTPQGMVWAMKAKVLEDDLKTIPKTWAITQNIELKVPGVNAQRRLIGLTDMRQSEAQNRN